MASGLRGCCHYEVGVLSVGGTSPPPNAASVQRSDATEIRSGGDETHQVEVKQLGPRRTYTDRRMEYHVHFRFY